jgi:hypothetical protein
VKEDILSRFRELGVHIYKGGIQFKPDLLRKTEFLEEEHLFRYVDLSGEKHRLQLNENSLGFTFCQVPIIYFISDQNKIEVEFYTKNAEQIEGLHLPKEISQDVFNRSGKVKIIHVYIKASILK